MKIGLHLADFTYPSGPGGLADDLHRIVVSAEEAGFARVSRPYDEIEKTAQLPLDVDAAGGVDGFLRRLEELAGMGIQAVQGKLPKVWEPERIALFEREIIPAAARM